MQTGSVDWAFVHIDFLQNYGILFAVTTELQNL